MLYLRNRRNQYVYQGMLWTGDNFSEVYDFLTGKVNNYVIVEGERIIVPIDGGHLIKTPVEGNLVIINRASIETVSIGNYVLRDHCYCVSSCSPEELERDYEIINN